MCIFQNKIDLSPYCGLAVLIHKVKTENVPYKNGTSPNTCKFQYNKRYRSEIGPLLFLKLAGSLRMFLICS